MPLLLVVGDIMFPFAYGISEVFTKMFDNGRERVNAVICTGNLASKSIFEYLKGIACAGPEDSVKVVKTGGGSPEAVSNRFICVRGEFDDPTVSSASNICNSSEEWAASLSAKRQESAKTHCLPEYAILEVGNVRIGVIHGNQLVPCNSKEVLETWQRKLDVDILITRKSKDEMSSTSSLVDVIRDKLYLQSGNLSSDGQCLLLDIDNGKVLVYTYTEVNGELNIEKYEWVRNSTL